MLFLAIFGKNVEDAFGHARYLAFYVAGGFVAFLTQTAVPLLFASHAAAEVPNLGASGAIAAVLGDYFVLYPNSRVFDARGRGPGQDLGLGVPRPLVPLPVHRGKLRPVLCQRQRRRRGVLRRYRGFIFGVIVARVLAGSGWLGARPGQPAAPVAG